MRIYRISSIVDSDFLKKFKPSGLIGLAAEALKCDTFEQFEDNFLGQIKHGTYWHITENPNFTIDPKLGPRDMSSMSNGRMTSGELMITTDLRNWLSEYPDRKYVAEIDMSQVDPKDYYQVNRGFGNEFIVTNPLDAKVIRVLSIQQAINLDKRRSSIIPNSQDGLRAFYDRVKTEYEEYTNMLGRS